MTMTPMNPTRRQLLTMIGQVAGAAAMYQAMTSMGFAGAGRSFTYSWSTMTPQERVDAALALGRQIHPQYDAEFMSGTSWVWHRVDWSLGCYGQWTEDLRDDHYKSLCEIDHRLVLAGEHCSHIPAWLEGSLLSALDAIKRLDQRENA